MTTYWYLTMPSEMGTLISPSQRSPSLRVSFGAAQHQCVSFVRVRSVAMDRCRGAGANGGAHSSHAVCTEGAQGRIVERPGPFMAPTAIDFGVGRTFVDVARAETRGGTYHDDAASVDAIVDHQLKCHGAILVEYGIGECKGRMPQGGMRKKLSSPVATWGPMW